MELSVPALVNVKQGTKSEKDAVDKSSIQMPRRRAWVSKLNLGDHYDYSEFDPHWESNLFCTVRNSSLVRKHWQGKTGKI